MYDTIGRRSARILLNNFGPLYRQNCRLGRNTYLHQDTIPLYLKPWRTLSEGLLIPCQKPTPRSPQQVQRGRKSLEAQAIAAQKAAEPATPVSSFPPKSTLVCFHVAQVAPLIILLPLRKFLATPWCPFLSGNHSATCTSYLPRTEPGSQEARPKSGSSICSRFASVG